MGGQKEDIHPVKDGNMDPNLVTDKKDVKYEVKTSNIEDLKFYPDDPESSYAKYRFMTKETSQFYDPCQESSKMSFKCLERNDYNRDMCKQYFDAYRECKKQWLASRRKNREEWH